MTQFAIGFLAGAILTGPISDTSEMGTLMLLCARWVVRDYFKGKKRRR